MGSDDGGRMTDVPIRQSSSGCHGGVRQPARSWKLEVGSGKLEVGRSMRIVKRIDH